jgi:cell division protein FtsB
MTRDTRPGTGSTRARPGQRPSGSTARLPRRGVSPAGSPSASRPESSRPSRPERTRPEKARPEARGSAPVPVETKNRRDPRSMRRLVLLGALVVFLLVLVTPTLRSYLAQKNQISQLQAQSNSLSSQIKATQKAKDQYSDPSYVQQQAQQRLGLVKPGQTLTVYVNGDGTVPAPNAAAGKAKQTWYGGLWNSVQAAAKK